MPAILPKSDIEEDNEQRQYRIIPMTTEYRTVSPIDILEVEREARRLRAEAMSAALRRFGAWITRRPVPQGETA